MRILVFLLSMFLSACVTTAISEPNISVSIPTLNLNLNNKSIVHINGLITYDDVRLIRKKRKKIKYLILNSPGGDMQFAYNIAVMVKYSNIITVIPKNGVCESACTIIFQAAKERHASKSSSLMYHGVSTDIKVMDAYFKECPSVTKQCLQVFNILKNLVKQETMRMYHVLEDYGLKHDVFLLLIKQPVDPNWLRTGNLTGYSEIRFTAEESMQHNAVTHIIEYQIIE